MDKQPSEKRFALLIDADNVSAKYIKPITDELSNYGTVTIKRIYGDWTLTLHAKWKDALLENSITPIQQFATPRQECHGFRHDHRRHGHPLHRQRRWLLPRVQRLGLHAPGQPSARERAHGHRHGGEEDPHAFRRACDVFTTLELLVQNKRNEKGGGSNAVPKDSVEQAVVDIITDNQNNGKATGLGEIGSRLQKRYPDFDVRSYGTNLLSKLLEEFTRVRITKRPQFGHRGTRRGRGAPREGGEAERAGNDPRGRGSPRSREGREGR